MLELIKTVNDVLNENEVNEAAGRKKINLLGPKAKPYIKASDVKINVTTNSAGSDLQINYLPDANVIDVWIPADRKYKK